MEKNFKNVYAQRNPSPEQPSACPSGMFTVGIIWPELKALKTGFRGGASGKEPPANAGEVRDVASIPGLERSPGGGHGNPF